MIKFNKKLFKNDSAIYIILLVIMAVLVFVPGTIIRTTCPVRLVTGLPCPGCGISRACALALHGEFHKSFIMHPFLVPTILLFVLFIFFKYFLVEGETRDRCLKVLYIVVYITAFLMIVFYVYRMITVFPHREPMLYDKKSLIPRIIEFFKK